MPITESWPVVKQVLAKLRTEKETAEAKVATLQKQIDAMTAAESEIDQVASANAAYVADQGAHAPVASAAPATLPDNLIDRL